MPSPLRRRLWSLQARAAPYLFLAPFAALFAVFWVYPLARSVLLSFQQSVGPRATRYVGLGNYRFLLADKLFWGALLNTAVYAALFLAVQIPASLGLAVLVNDRRVRGRAFFRFAFFSAYLVGAVFVAVLFNVLLGSRTGLVNRTLTAISPKLGPIGFLSDPAWAMPAVLLASWWISIGYGMIYFLAALQAVDRELYEQASVDGAGPWTRFRHVTLPGIRPVTVFLILVGTIGAFQLFELPYILFGGPGPNYRGLTVVMYLFLVGFEAGDLGYASAVGWALVFVVAIVSVVQVRLLRSPK